MLSPIEALEIRQAVHQEVAEIERRVHAAAGSYRYLCSVDGMTIYTHHPVGRVLRHL